MHFSRTLYFYFLTYVHLPVSPGHSIAFFFLCNITGILSFRMRQIFYPLILAKMIYCPWNFSDLVHTGTRIYNEHRPVLFALIQIKVYGIAQEKAICFIGCPDTTSGDVSSFPKGTSPDINSIFFIYALIAFPV